MITIDWQAFWLTARLALITSLILILIGLPLAWWLARTRFRGAVFVEALVALPLVLPPTVLGFYVLMFLGPYSPLGSAYEALAGTLLPFSFPGLVIASVLFSLPFAVQPFLSGFRSVDTRLLDASVSLGAGRLPTFFRVGVPLAWPGLLAGFVLSFAHTLGEFGVVLMVGGNIAGKTRTISISIYDSVQAMDYATAGWTSALLLVISASVLILTYTLQRRYTKTWLRT
ncbi:MAG: molybdate ABC transporter permease subunit [Opitutales bacterium]|nr:molybdate ABC transporter permease subunit [Opitutales bacterium]